MAYTRNSSHGNTNGPQRATREVRKRRVYHRRKVCRFCADASMEINYKDPKSLRYFTTERGKIIPRRISGTCAKHQRSLTVAIKRARTIALLPFVGTMEYN